MQRMRSCTSAAGSTRTPKKHAASACATRWYVLLLLTQVNLAAVATFAVLGYLPRASAFLSFLSTLYTLWSLAWRRPPSLVLLGLALCLPLGAHLSLTSHYATAQAAWAAHTFGFQDAPQLPRATPHEVVALLGGVVWTLPIWHGLCVTTESLALPTQST